ncbi:MAG TPA: hypothetical protein PKD54_09985 [Pirellulaceae bacterium]|nr:hypothetical protein [Pirellulaceae bacterium]
MPLEKSVKRLRTRRTKFDDSYLDPDRIIETIEVLKQRIADRFPDSGLLGVCHRLSELAVQARERAAFIVRPILWLRLSIWLVIAAIFLGLGYLVVILPEFIYRVTENWESVDAFTQEMLLLFAGLYFLISLEHRLKSRRALSAIHEIRAIAHVIDMHQLTKDPERLMSNWSSGKHSPKMQMNAFELNRYLDYCTEMLALLGKIAAFYVQRFDGEVAIESAGEVERLTSSLNDKIWQKIMLLNSIQQQVGLATPIPPANVEIASEAVAPPSPS